MAVIQVPESLASTVSIACRFPPDTAASCFQNVSNNWRSLLQSLILPFPSLFQLLNPPPPNWQSHIKPLLLLCTVPLPPIQQISNFSHFIAYRTIYETLPSVIAVISPLLKISNLHAKHISGGIKRVGPTRLFVQLESGFLSCLMAEQRMT